LSPVVRLAAFFILGFAGVLAISTGKARASVVEFCPAHMAGDHAFATPNDGLVAFEVAAESARSVSANVIVQGGSSWYTFQFVNAALAPDLAHYESHTVRFDRTLYHTKTMYVKLPAGERIVRWWIYDAASIGDAQFGWDKRGDVTCLPQPDGESTFEPLAGAPKRVNDGDDDLSRLPSASDTVLETFTIPTPKDLTECAQPFVLATVTHAVSPDYPHSAPRLSTNVVSEIEVALNADGSLAGAWVYTPSGVPDLDREALKAAELSKYHGGIALCRPAPGTYLFRADFDPN
jgi:hypothetical protein